MRTTLVCTTDRPEHAPRRWLRKAMQARHGTDAGEDFSLHLIEDHCVPMVAFGDSAGLGRPLFPAPPGGRRHRVGKHGICRWQPVTTTGGKAGQSLSML